MPDAISLRNPGFYGVRDYTIGGRPTEALLRVELARSVEQEGRLPLTYPSVPEMIYGEGLRLRVYFPSWDGAVWSAPIAEGTYPLVVFLHGERNVSHGICPVDTTNDYQRWWAALHLLARTGVVVACPDLSGVISHDPETVVRRLQQTIHFMRNVWEFHSSVSPSLGLAGHSWGANAAINAAVSGAFDVHAYASVAVTRAANYSEDYRALRIPTLLIAGVDDYLNEPLRQPYFDLGPTPRYQVALAGIGHWGWFAPPELWRCHGGHETCRSGAWIISEILASFFAKHLAGDDAVVPYLVETPVFRSDLSMLNESPCAAKVMFRTSADSNNPWADFFTPEQVGWGPVPWQWRLFGGLIRQETVTIGRWSGSSPF